MSPRVLGSTILAALVVAVAQPSPIGAQPPAPSTDTSRGLSIRYADGRTVTSPVRRSGGMWTPRFPKTPGVDTSRRGQPLATLDVKHAIDGPDVVVTVSLSYGRPSQNLTRVATVRLSDEAPVPIDELRAYGVEPIVVSLVPIASATAYAPAAASVSAQVFVRAEAVGPNASAYRIVVSNDGSQPLMWFQFKAFRGEHVALVGRPRGRRNLPLLQPGEERAFEVATSTGGRPDSPDGPDEWRAIDRIEVTSVMWQDGVVEGDPGQAVEQRSVDRRRGEHLGRMLQSLRAPILDSVEDLRRQIEEHPAPDAETRQLRDSTLASLDAFLGSATPTDAPVFRAWLSRVAAEYAAWLARTVPAPR